MDFDNLAEVLSYITTRIMGANSVPKEAISKEEPKIKVYYKSVDDKVHILEGTIQDDGSIICEPLTEKITVVDSYGLKSLGQMLDTEVTDTQTENIVEGILLLVTNYPKAKLLVDYDKEIMMILPKEERVSEELSTELVSLGWENLKYKPWMWPFKVEGYVADYY